MPVIVVSATADPNPIRTIESPFDIEYEVKSSRFDSNLRARAKFIIEDKEIGFVRPKGTVSSFTSEPFDVPEKGGVVTPPSERSVNVQNKGDIPIRFKIIVEVQELDKSGKLTGAVSSATINMKVGA